MLRSNICYFIGSLNLLQFEEEEMSFVDSNAKQNLATEGVNGNIDDGSITTTGGVNDNADGGSVSRRSIKLVVSFALLILSIHIIYCVIIIWVQSSTKPNGCGGGIAPAVADENNSGTHLLSLMEKSQSRRSRFRNVRTLEMCFFQKCVRC